MVAIAGLGLLIPFSQAETVHHILSTGQSLSLGCLGTPPYDAEPYGKNITLTALSPPARILPIIPATALAYCDAGGSEYPLLAAANQLTYATGGPNMGWTIAVTPHGVSGAPYSALCGPSCPGGPTGPFTLGQTQIRLIKNNLSPGQTYSLEGVYVTHGETDDQNSVSAAAYEGYLAQWQADYETLAETAPNRTRTLPVSIEHERFRPSILPMFIDQEAAWGHYHGVGTAPNTALGQYMAMENYPDKIYLVSPKYFLPTADSVHLTGASYLWLGEIAAKAMKTVLVDKHRWTPLTPRRVSRTGSVVVIDFFVPVGSLQFDTTTVEKVPNYGFEFFDSNSSASIAGVYITSPDSVTLTLSGVPTGIQRVRYAYTALQGRPSGAGNLKDTDPTPSRTGNNLSDWAVTFDVPIDFESNLETAARRTPRLKPR